MNIVITGASGQDGIFLIDKLLKETKAKIFACTRNEKNFDFNKLRYLDNNEDFSRVKIVELDFLNYQKVLDFIKDTSPEILFNLMGPSSVKSFIENPVHMESITNKSFENIINSLINTNNFCNFFHSSSSEMYGYESKIPFNENSRFEPNTSYAKSKFKLHKKCLDMLEIYEWPIISGVMFNHESEFRSSKFLIMNLIENAIAINNGEKINITIPSLEISRDWSYARDITNAIFNLTINKFSGTYLIGSGISTSLKEITKYIFNKIDLDYTNFINIKLEELRAGEPLHIGCDPSKVRRDTGWEADNDIFYAIDKMFSYKNL